MDIDLPEVVAEVRAAFEAYERARRKRRRSARRHVSRRPAYHPVRYRREPFGYDEIKSFRAARSPRDLARTLSHTVITTCGRHVAVASTLFHRATAPGKVGRQTQTWVRFPEGWRVAAAHVSVIAEG